MATLLCLDISRSCFATLQILTIANPILTNEFIIKHNRPTDKTIKSKMPKLKSEDVGIPPGTVPVYDISCKDVVMGRGSGTQNHCGNVTYRKLVFLNKVRVLYRV